MLKESCNDEWFVGALVQGLETRDIAAGTTVIQKGEIGREMFLIGLGEMDVINDEGTVVFTLREGGFFGEISLGFELKRTATIVAKTNCEAYVMTTSTFVRVLRKYPSHIEGIRGVFDERFANIAVNSEECQRTELWSDTLTPWSWERHPRCPIAVRTAVLSVYSGISFVDHHGETRCLPSEVAYEICRFMEADP